MFINDRSNIHAGELREVGGSEFDEVCVGVGKGGEVLGVRIVITS